MYASRHHEEFGCSAHERSAVRPRANARSVEAGTAVLLVRA